MRVIESNNDGFEFERAFVGERDGAPVPIAVMGGVECNIETKPGPLLSGLAFCEPLNVKLAQDWPVSVRVQDGEDGAERTISKMTADPKVVAAARHYWDIVAAGPVATGTALG